MGEETYASDRCKTGALLREFGVWVLAFVIFSPQFRVDPVKEKKKIRHFSFKHRENTSPNPGPGESGAPYLGQDCLSVWNKGST